MRITREGLIICLVLPASRGVGMDGEKSAEGIVGLLRPDRRPEGNQRIDALMFIGDGEQQNERNLKT